MTLASPDIFWEVSPSPQLGHSELKIKQGSSSHWAVVQWLNLRNPAQDKARRSLCTAWSAHRQGASTRKGKKTFLG